MMLLPYYQQLVGGESEDTPASGSRRGALARSRGLSVAGRSWKEEAAAAAAAGAAAAAAGRR